MSGPFIRESGLVNRWLQCHRRSVSCISCNGCFEPGLEEGGIYCLVENKEEEKAAKSLQLQDDESHSFPNLKRYHMIH